MIYQNAGILISVTLTYYFHKTDKQGSFDLPLSLDWGLCSESPESYQGDINGYDDGYSHNQNTAGQAIGIGQSSICVKEIPGLLKWN